MKNSTRQKVFILNFLILSSLGLQLKAMNPDLAVQNGDIKSQAICNSKQDKGSFANHEERFKAKRIKKRTNTLKKESYVEPKKCSIMTTVLTGVGGLYYWGISRIRYSCFHFCTMDWRFQQYLGLKS